MELIQSALSTLSDHTASVSPVRPPRGRMAEQIDFRD